MTRIGQVIALVIMVLVLMLVSLAGNAQTWPTSWTQVDTDPNENGWSDNTRDVEYAYINYDDDYIYFRLSLYYESAHPTAPDLTSERFKWFIDTSGNLALSGGSFINAEYLLFVEDNGGGIEVYFFASGDGSFTEFENPNDFTTNPGPISDATRVGYRVVGLNVDLYVARSEIGDPSLSSLQFAWATDQQNSNLEQAPTTDTTDSLPLVISLPGIDLSLTKSVNPTTYSVGSTVTFTITVSNASGFSNASGVLRASHRDLDCGCPCSRKQQESADHGDSRCLRRVQQLRSSPDCE